MTSLREVTEKAIERLMREQKTKSREYVDKIIKTSLGNKHVMLKNARNGLSKAVLLKDNYSFENWFIDGFREFKDEIKLKIEKELNQEEVNIDVIAECSTIIVRANW